MNWIVFDLEWNMGYQPYVFSYGDANITLRGEMIQIGAVRIDAHGNITEEYCANLRPRIFRRLHHQIAKVTGLTQQALQEGVPIQDGLADFAAWCGDDAELFTWGPDDIGVLKQNFYLNGLSLDFPRRFYDLQRIYTAQYPRVEGEGLSLEAVIARWELPQLSTFHDALADACYTAAVCTKLDLAAGLAAYPDTDALLHEALPPMRPEVPPEDWLHVAPTPNKEAWDDAAYTSLHCPTCGAPLANDPDSIWIKKGNHGRTMLCTCPKHGAWMVRWKRMQQDGLHWEFARCTESPSTEAQAQWHKRKAAQLAALRRKQAEAAQN